MDQQSCVYIQILHSTHQSSYEELQLTKAQLDVTRDMLVKEQVEIMLVFILSSMMLSNLVAQLSLRHHIQEHRHREHLQHERDMDVKQRKCEDLELRIDTLTTDLERTMIRADDFEKR